jgi:hypothetical protein
MQRWGLQGFEVAVFINKHFFYRRDAKSAKCLIVFIKDFLCVLCVSAVNIFLTGTK